MLGFLRRNYLSIDPRTLGLLRIGIACLLLLDLAKRVPVLRLFYVNQGLIPNHRVLWRPPREFAFSYLLSLSSVREVQVAFVLIALVYLCFLIGFRTRLMHVLSWLSLISLHVRADILSSGADFVFGVLILWSLFLPLGAGLVRQFRENHPSSRYIAGSARRGRRQLLSDATDDQASGVAEVFCTDAPEHALRTEAARHLYQAARRSRRELGAIDRTGA